MQGKLTQRKEKQNMVLAGMAGNQLTYKGRNKLNIIWSISLRFVKNSFNIFIIIIGLRVWVKVNIMDDGRNCKQNKKLHFFYFIWDANYWKIGGL